MFGKVTLSAIVCGLALLVTITGCKGEDKPATGPAPVAGPTAQGAVPGELVLPPMDLAKLPFELEKKLSAARQKARSMSGDFDKLMEFGALAYVHGFPDAAGAAFKRARDVATDPDKAAKSALAWYCLARACEKTGDKAQAIAAYTELLKLKPDVVPAQARLAALKGEPPPASQAVDPYERQLLYLGRDIDTVIAGATFFAESGKHAEALSALEEIRDLDPASEVRVRTEIARAQLAKGDVEAAQREITTAATAPGGKENVGVREVQALIYVMKGEADKAEPLFREILAATAPGSSYPFGAANALAWILATYPARLKPTEAVQLAERANEASNSTQAAILDTLAAAYASAGRYDDAVKTIQRAIEIADKDPRQARDIESFRARQKLYEEKKPYVSK